MLDFALFLGQKDKSIITRIETSERGITHNAIEGVSQKDKSIITRIETFYANGVIENLSQKDKSIITRIETKR